MSALPGSLSLFLPLLVKLLKGPGTILVAINGLLTGLLLWLTINAVRDGHPSVWLFLIIAALLLLGILVFAIRGSRLSKHVDELANLQVEPSQEIITADGRSTRDEEINQRIKDAAYEASLRDGKFMPRVKAAQRAAIAAAGGTVQAPYLKADLRITIIAGLVTLAAGPLSFFLLILTAIIS
ncbi:hypothetical protein [Flaviflexus massiliensis]|uniref:hypothetical protein n=1 Tax=Flaviflexus massiliensis TaxID=1522309 RepID=UPI0006D55570|nr:hypothetical protein [Flaviflexus massiliensis]